MMKKILSVLGIGTVAAVSYTCMPPSVKVENLPVTPTPIPVSARINITCDSTCNPIEIDSLPEIVQKVISIQSSDCFKDYLKNIDPNQTNKLTVNQVIDLVTTAKVTSQITYYYQGRNWFTKNITVGFENGDGKIHANRAAWDYMNTCEKAANVAHELTHGAPMNFTHDFNNTTRRPLSVPYMVGSAITKCCK